MEQAIDGIGPSLRRASAASSIVSVPTPSRDLSFRRGAYTKNILRLEQSAEEMSAGGSDIGEEIKRMNEAEKSRRSSVQSSAQGESRSAPLDVPTRSRTGSVPSNSILDLNNNARVGGYSPGGFVTSPSGSVRSASWSRPTAHRNVSSSSRSSRLFDMAESPFEDRPPLDLGLAFSSAPSRQLSQSSYAVGDDSTIGGHEQHVVVPHPLVSANPDASSPASELGLEHVVPEQAEYRPGSATPPVRPSSTDTFQQAQMAFKDFDGVHYSPETDEYIELDQDGNEIRRVSARSSTVAPITPHVSLMPSAPDTRGLFQGTPLPPEGMVYYPAPVPKMLNLPKRLSQLPAASVQAKRKTQALAAPRGSAMWMPAIDATAGLEHRHSEQPQDLTREPLNQRLSVANFTNVPPQLRASVFFEHQTVVQDVEVQADSAVATLDSILAASATAPVSAFTDHLYVGDTSKTSYAPEKLVRRSTANDLRLSTMQTPANRQSGIAGLLKRASTSNLLTTKTSRSTLLNQDSPYASVSQDLAERSDEDEHDHALTEGEQIEQDFHDEENLEDIAEEEEPQFAQPTTLLAELQVRKAQQKSRNRTAATAFPNGMHSTLLQMDAVAEIDRKKRSNQRVALVWEDPNLKEVDDAQNSEDEEVPLGMLFPNKNGLAHRKLNNDDDWNRPLGLMEKREMEDNEPLSSRRSRLRGEPIQRPRMQSQMPPSMPDDEETEGDGETLAQRSRRVSSKIALDSAISDVVPLDGSRPLSTFTDEVIGQFSNKGASNEPQPVVDLENETLGQRKARLGRESAQRPPLQQRNSMSNLLATNPVGERRRSKHFTPASGTLLHTSDQAQADNKRSLLNANMRSSSYGSQRPQLVNAHSAATLQPMAMQQPVYANNAFGMYPSMSMPMFTAQNNGYFMPMPMQTQSQMNPLAYGMLTGQTPMYPAYAGTQMGMMNYNNAMAQAYGFGPDGISIQQRAAIDQWRSSVAR